MIRQRPLQRLRHPTVRASDRHREDAPGLCRRALAGNAGVSAFLVVSGARRRARAV